MAVTIEPGFYQVPHLLKGSALSARVMDAVNWDRLALFSDVRGVRIEDDVLVTESSYDIISAAAPDPLSFV